ncbi:MAG: transposase [Candidatus Marinimicrobia bacterium]|nr:transposase [Candidatus Neomarinimicrobiota bacterium]
MKSLIEHIQPIIDSKSCKIFSVDESHFTTDPFITRGWIKRGKKKLRITVYRRKRTLFGALNLRTKRIYFKSAPTGNSHYFKMFLNQLRWFRKK